VLARAVNDKRVGSHGGIVPKAPTRLRGRLRGEDMVPG
jgi:hypothetical protein